MKISVAILDFGRHIGFPPYWTDLIISDVILALIDHKNPTNIHVVRTCAKKHQHQMGKHTLTHLPDCPNFKGGVQGSEKFEKNTFVNLTHQSIF